MTDVQLLTAIKARSNKRSGNFLFINIINELERQARLVKLERNIMLHLSEVCKVYGVKLDEHDLNCINQERSDWIVDQERIRKLLKVGFKII